MVLSPRGCGAHVVGPGLSRASLPSGTFGAADRRRRLRPRDQPGRRMCHALTRGVYCSLVALHELAHQPRRGRHAKPRVLAERSASRVPVLAASVVRRNKRTPDSSLLGVCK